MLLQLIPGLIVFAHYRLSDQPSCSVIILVQSQSTLRQAYRLETWRDVDHMLRQAYRLETWRDVDHMLRQAYRLETWRDVDHMLRQAYSTD